MTPERRAKVDAERGERLFRILESHPDEGERSTIEAALRKPATKLDVAAAMVLQAQFNTELVRVLLEVQKRGVLEARDLIQIALLQQQFGLEMVDFIQTLVPDEV